MIKVWIYNKDNGDPVNSVDKGLFMRAIEAHAELLGYGVETERGDE